ncbi:MAG: beta-lactamase family protein [Phycisphaerae bacterium]|nr:beta-lactamase family protein [Phycisphaerae bacterium]
MRSVLRPWIVILLLTSNALSAQDVVLSVGAPSAAGMDETILAAAVHMYETAVRQDQVRNIVLLVARDGKVVLHEAMGWKDKEQGIPLAKDAMFRMASNTKPVIATGISILVEEGKLNYRDLVRRHIAAFDNYRSGAITIHHLLTHTSGFRIEPIFFGPLMQKSPEHPDAPSLQLEVARFGEVGATELPGTTYEYSNPGYNTLGALAEVASGQPLDVFLRERIYAPLGMIDSYHHEVADKLDGKLDRMSVVYDLKEDGQWEARWRPGAPPQYPFVRASGGMISTATDYAIFCQMFLNGGVYNDTRILKEETVAAMTSPQTASIYTAEERERRDSYYGYGWNVSRDGIFSHGGSDGTAAWVVPDRKLIVLAFTQSPGKHTGRLGTRFLKLVQASIAD